jgi:hypothetical protein
MSGVLRLAYGIGACEGSFGSVSMWQNLKISMNG